MNKEEMLKKLAEMSEDELKELIPENEEEMIHYPDEKFSIYKESGSYHKEYDNLDDLIEDAIKHRKNYGFQASFSVIDDKDNIVVKEDASDNEMRKAIRKAFIHFTNDWSVGKVGWRQTFELVFFNKRNEITFEFTYKNGYSAQE